MIAAHFLAQMRHFRKTCVVAMRVEDNDGPPFLGELLDDAASRPSLSGSCHRENCEVSCHDGVAVDRDVNVCAVGQMRQVQRAMPPIGSSEVSNDDTGNVV